MLEELLGDVKGFIENIADGLLRLGIAHSELAMMDHICYRVETVERYQELLEKLKTTGTLVGENKVNGRMIATFELNAYISAGGWTVPYLELPEPKQGSPYAEGLEHAELVVIGSLKRFMDHHLELPFSFNGMNKKINPEVGLKAGGISVKFHEQQLGAVVRIEQSLQKGGI